MSGIDNTMSYDGDSQGMELPKKITLYVEQVYLQNMREAAKEKFSRHIFIRLIRPGLKP